MVIVQYIYTVYPTNYVILIESLYAENECLNTRTSKVIYGTILLIIRAYIA